MLGSGLIKATLSDKEFIGYIGMYQYCIDEMVQEHWNNKLSTFD